MSSNLEYAGGSRERERRLQRSAGWRVRAMRQARLNSLVDVVAVATAIAVTGGGVVLALGADGR